MKKGNQIFAGCLAAIMLCCACSARTNRNPQEAGTTVPNTAAAIPIAKQGSGFTDVTPGAWYEDAANWCREQGILDGDTFSPNMEMTRATVAEALYRAEGSPEVTAANFPDVSAGSAYANAAAWASANGVMSGYTDGLFGADDPVTREQMAAILWRYAGKPAAEAGQDFADEASIAGFARTAVDWARVDGVMGGKDGNRFDPQGTLTRAETAAILYRYLTGEENTTESGGTSIVYMTTDISAEGMLAIYKALDWTPVGNVAVKLSTGEPPASNYLAPALIADVVQEVNGTIVECNTAYGGSRANTAMHYQVAEDHGFTAIADVVIMDENGSMTLPVTGGTRLTENYVGEHFKDYDSFLILSHFKGHSMAGFGGAIKNISIGIASSKGKGYIHSGGTGGNMWSADQDAFLETMGETGKSVVDALDGQIVYINVMNRLSVDCDCDGHPAEPDMHDIGILVSYDPVALDQACVDLCPAGRGRRVPGQPY